MPNEGFDVAASLAQRPPTPSKGVPIGRFAGVRLGYAAPCYLGVVLALVQEADGRIVATVALFPGHPETVTARSGDARHRASGQWVQGFRLPALDRLQIPASLVVPASLALPGRSVELWEEGAAMERTVREVLEHGADFDRVRVS